MIIEHADTPQFKRIHSELNALLFSATPAAPSNVIIVDQGDYEDEVKEFLRENSTPPPTKPSTTTDTDELLISPVEPAASTNLDEAPLPPSPSHHVATSITLQESHTVTTSSQSISITTHPSKPETEDTPPAEQPKKRRPAPKKKGKTGTSNASASDTANATPAPTTRGTRASTRKNIQLPEDPQPAIRDTGRKHTKKV